MGDQLKSCKLCLRTVLSQAESWMSRISITCPLLDTSSTHCELFILFPRITPFIWAGPRDHTWDVADTLADTVGTLLLLVGTLLDFKHGQTVHFIPDEHLEHLWSFRFPCLSVYWPQLCPGFLFFKQLKQPPTDWIFLLSWVTSLMLCRSGHK